MSDIEQQEKIEKVSFPLTVNVQVKNKRDNQLETQIVSQSDAPFQLKAVKAIFLQVLQSFTMVIFWMLQDQDYQMFDIDKDSRQLNGSRFFNLAQIIVCIVYCFYLSTNWIRQKRLQIAIFLGEQIFLCLAMSSIKPLLQYYNFYEKFFEISIDNHGLLPYQLLKIILFYTLINRLLGFFVILFFFNIIKKPAAFILISFILNIFLGNYLNFKGDLEHLEDKFRLLIISFAIIQFIYIMTNYLLMYNLKDTPWAVTSAFHMHYILTIGYLFSFWKLFLHVNFSKKKDSSSYVVYNQKKLDKQQKEQEKNKKESKVKKENI